MDRPADDMGGPRQPDRNAAMLKRAMASGCVLSIGFLALAGFVVSSLGAAALTFIYGDTATVLDRLPNVDGERTVWRSVRSQTEDPRWTFTVPKSRFGIAAVHRIASWEDRNPNRLALADPPAWSGANTPVDYNDPAFASYIWDVAYGWPAPAWKASLIGYPVPSVSRGGVLVGGIGLGAERAGGVQRVLIPLTPVWSGVIINTSFFAGVSWIAFAGCRALLRRRRRVRGLCAWCGYALTGEPICPECGRATPHHAVPST